MLEALPEFVDRFLDLVEAADGDPGAAASFTELAEFLSGSMVNLRPTTLAGTQAVGDLLHRCLVGVERVARESGEAEELVGWAFLDSLCPSDLEALWPGLGPQTLCIAQAMGLEPPDAP